MRKRPTPLQLIALAAFVWVTGWSAGCQSNDLTVTVPRVERFLLNHPDTPQREIDRALSERAEAYARTRSYAQVWLGRGLSMEPLIPADAWIVSETLPYESLERGQVVLFNGSPGRRVAHALVRKTGQGWLTAGINNQQVIDHPRVTRRNYLGVITAAFVAERPPPPTDPN